VQNFFLPTSLGFKKESKSMLVMKKKTSNEKCTQKVLMIHPSANYILLFSFTTSSFNHHINTISTPKNFTTYCVVIFCLQHQVKKLTTDPFVEDDFFILNLKQQPHPSEAFNSSPSRSPSRLCLLARIEHS